MKKKRVWGIAIGNRNWDKPVFHCGYADKEEAFSEAKRMKSLMPENTVYISYVSLSRINAMTGKAFTMSADESAFIIAVTGDMVKNG